MLKTSAKCKQIVRISTLKYSPKLWQCLGLYFGVRLLCFESISWLERPLLTTLQPSFFPAVHCNNVKGIFIFLPKVWEVYLKHTSRFEETWLQTICLHEETFIVSSCSITHCPAAALLFVFRGNSISVERNRKQPFSRFLLLSTAHSKAPTSHTDSPGTPQMRSSGTARQWQLRAPTWEESRDTLNVFNERTFFFTKIFFYPEMMSLYEFDCFVKLCWHFNACN